MCNIYRIGPKRSTDIHDRMPAVLRTDEDRGFLDPEIRWNLHPFAGLLLVTPCASPLVKPRDTGLQQQEMF
jgi:putative SOS response-associated peptidase YedK